MPKNYDSIAKMYGGESVDYDSLAAEHGGAVEDQPKAQTTKKKPVGVSAIEGALRGVYDPFTGLAQMAYNAMPESVQTAGNRLNDYLAQKTGMFPTIGQGGFNQAIAQDEASYKQRKGDGLDLPRIAGNVVSPINAAIATKMPQAVGMLPRMVSGSATGATQAMTMPVTQGNFAQEKLNQGNIGATVGGALPVVAGGVARVVSPKASVNPDIALLRSKGVNPTIGQTLGGMANTTEQKATSMIGVGDSIRNAREGARNQFNKAVINDALAPIGETVDEVGHAGVKQAGDKISKVYEKVWDTFKGLQFDQKFTQDVGTLKTLANGLTPPMKAKFNTVLANELEHRISPNGGITSETLKKAYEGIGKVQRQYSKASGSEGELGDALKTLQSHIMEQVNRASPEAAKAMSSADAAWARLVRLEDAAKRSVVNDGVFTPGQFLGAVKSNSASVRGRDFSRGTALGQKLGEAGQRVLGNTYPDSGTAGRMLPLAQLGGTAAAPIPMLAGTAVGMGAYNPAVQKLLVDAITKRGASSPLLANEIRKLAPVLNPLGYGLLNSGN